MGVLHGKEATTCVANCVPFFFGARQRNFPEWGEECHFQIVIPLPVMSHLIAKYHSF